MREDLMTRRSMGSALVGLSLAGGCSHRSSTAADGRTHLRFSTWGEPVEIAAFRRVIERYHQTKPGIRIDLEEVSYKYRSQIDAQIAAGVGPDLLRVTYLDIGRYSPSSALIDLSRYLPASLGIEFTEPVWTAVKFEGRPHALPHHTDTSAILYNKTLFDQLGLRAPERIEDSWTFDEFTGIARSLKKGGSPYGFAMNWTLGGAFRWLNFLYQHGGRLLDADLRKPAIRSREALETVRWTQSWFREGLVPPSDSAKSVEQVENLFATGVVGMYFDSGPQSLQELRPNFKWAATYLPKDVQMASELGGNAIGVTRDSQHPEAAADFALFLTNEANMRDFVSAAQFLPVRKKLVSEGVHYSYRPDEMVVHQKQAETVPLHLAATVTLPKFHQINRTLGDELNAAFSGGQSAEATVEHIARKIEAVIT